jgi:hypothetical protein
VEQTADRREKLTKKGDGDPPIYLTWLASTSPTKRRGREVDAYFKKAVRRYKCLLVLNPPLSYVKYNTFILLGQERQTKIYLFEEQGCQA